MPNRHDICNHPHTKAARAECRRGHTKQFTDALVTHTFVFVRQARKQGHNNLIHEITLYEVAQEYGITDWDFKLACRMVRDHALLMDEFDLLAPEMLQVKR